MDGNGSDSVSGKEEAMEILALTIGVAILAALKPTEAQSRRLLVASRLQQTLR